MSRLSRRTSRLASLPPVRAAATAAIALLAACAAVPLQPDLAARAPELPGYGTLQWPIATASAAAQRLYTQGVLQAYAFNEHEAIRMFKAALAQDPRCAACAWGVAWQLGPNINQTSRDNVNEALRYVAHALRHAGTATPRERALIDALALRYGHASQAQQARDMAPLTAARCTPGQRSGDKAHPLDVAYALRLRELADASPGDPDLLSLYAEAEMVATRSDWWQAGADNAAPTPAGRIGELAAMLEAALAQHPGHVGLNHYLIHAVDAPGVAPRAVAAADRLGALAPASPHLLHMPGHIYIRVGRYADAAQVNMAAVEADEALFAAQKAQGFEISKDWRNHDQHFLWFAALMQGRGDVALQAARALADRAGAANHAFADYRRSLPMLTLLRLGRWDALLAEPLPAGSSGLAAALGHGARGVAQAQRQQLDAARASLAQAEAAAATVSKDHAGSDESDVVLRGMASAAAHRLRAEVASAQGQHDDALAQQAQAVADAKKADEWEPPMLAAGALAALGQMQLRAGRPADAEASFRADLLAQPGNGWALNGLAQALRAQGRAADAKAVQGPLDSAWPQADAGLRSGF